MNKVQKKAVGHYFRAYARCHWDRSLLREAEKRMIHESGFTGLWAVHCMLRVERYLDELQVSVEPRPFPELVNTWLTRNDDDAQTWTHVWIVEAKNVDHAQRIMGQAGFNMRRWAGGPGQPYCSQGMLQQLTEDRVMVWQRGGLDV